jgi:cation diffusion facilitator CzcD-associated flavoprotein CzcO
MTQTEVEPLPAATDASTYDVVIIGAGLTGLAQLHAVRGAGLSVVVLEAGGGVGGTWYWNRYPGCRLDSESYTYQYAFDDDLLAETNWSELFASQPELERYYNTVADRLQLRSHIRLNTRVESMVWDEATRVWTLRTDAGAVVRSRFVITATGILSAPNYPPLPGIERFKGELYHTGTWPQSEVDFTGKRVAVVGTGASGVQIIPVAAQTAGHLTVFQRTPNWAVPLRNEPLTDEDRQRLKAEYPAIFERLRSTSNGFLHDWGTPLPADISDMERLAVFEAAWNGPGFSKWFGLPRDIAVNPAVNRLFCEFVANKIRERVHDPKVAEMLIPKDHLFGTKRVPCETAYFEAYNRPNVELISLADNPILEYTETGFRTAAGDLDFDMIVLATGFDAFTGALTRIDIRGVDGLSLRDKWAPGPKTFLGLQVAGFPNLFINGGPHGKGGIGNSPRASEPVIPWLVELLLALREKGYTRIEADVEAEEEWTAHVNELVVNSLAKDVRSYSYGDNVPGKAHTYIAYAGSLVDFVERLADIAENGYKGFQLS